MHAAPTCPAQLRRAHAAGCSRRLSRCVTRRAVPSSSSNVAEIELRVCTSKTCKRQGAESILKFSEDLHLPNVRASSCGCLGNCGSGPNLVLLPQERVVSHVATAADLVQVLQTFCDVAVDNAVVKATQLRLAGNAHASSHEYAEAIACYTQALDLKPASSTQVAMLYSNRSAAYLQAGDKEASLADARRAVDAAPKGFHTAHIRLIDCFYALGQYTEAAAACRQASALDSSFRFTPAFPVRALMAFSFLPSSQTIKRALQAAGQQV